MISAGESVVISAGECCDFGRGAIRGLISAGESVVISSGESVVISAEEPLVG